MSIPTDEISIIEAYRAEKLSAGQVAELLGLSVIQTEAFLKEKGVELPYTLEDLEADRQAIKRVLGGKLHISNT